MSEAVTQFQIVTRYGVPVRMIRTLNDFNEAQRARRKIRRQWKWYGLKIEAVA